MVDVLALERDQLTVSAMEKRAAAKWRVIFVVLLGVSALVGYSLLSPVPMPSAIGWLIYLIALAAIFYEPRYGVYLLIFFSLTGDNLVIPWYPFNKNFSSGESLLYLNSSMIFSPLELTLALTTVAWLVRGLMQRKLDFYSGALFKPMVIFTGFLVFGLAYGIGRRGNVNIALWEARAIFYLVLYFVLVSNLLQKREHVITALWAVVLALFLEGIAGTLKVTVELGGNLKGIEAIGEHSMSVHEGTLIVLIAIGFLYKLPRKQVLLMLAMLPPVFYAYVSNQRRASYISVGLALALLAFPLYKENRKAFWRIVPTLAVIGVIYTAAFWNSSSGIAAPARAIRSVIAPVKDGRDDRSNVYRDIENINTGYTIRKTPLTGVGFGQKFYIIAPLPDISFFAWWEYITHNSVIWFWMKTGGGGFFMMAFLVSFALMRGARVVWRAPSGWMAAAGLLASLYLIMHFIYAYVDMSWEGQSLMYVGLMMGLINRLEDIIAVPVKVPPKRWPWQADPPPVPGLLPIE